jgi:hypothetical protein
MIAIRTHLAPLCAGMLAVQAALPQAAPENLYESRLVQALEGNLIEGNAILGADRNRNRAVSRFGEPDREQHHHQSRPTGSFPRHHREQLRSAEIRVA